MRLRISAIASMLGVAAFLAACDFSSTDNQSRTLSPAEAAARAQATIDSATKYKDSLVAARKADSLAWVAQKATWKTDSLSFIAKAKLASDAWKKDSAKAVALFKKDSTKARKQFVKDSSAWVKDSLAGIKTLTKDSAAWQKKKAADSVLYDKAVAAMEKKYTKDSLALVAVHTKFLTLLGKDSAAITKAQEAVNGDNDSTKASLKAAHLKALDKANAKLAADQAKYDAAVLKATTKVTTDSTAGEAAKQAKLDKRAADSATASAKYTKDSTAAATKVATRVATWSANSVKDSTTLATDTASYNLKLRTKVAAKVTKDSLDSLKRVADSLAIRAADSSFVVKKAVPAFSLAAGTYTATPQTVTITTAFPNGKIYYTLDGTTPDSTKTAYTASLSLAIGKTVKAIAYDSAKKVASKPFGAVYVVGTASTPTFSTTTADTAASLTVVVTMPDSADLYYTIDGTTPTTASTKLSNAAGKDTIILTKSATVKALAVKTGRINAAVVSQAYVLTAPAPYFNRKDTSIVGSFYVKINDTLDTAVTIRYTTNGVAPTATTGTALAKRGDSILVDKIMTIKAIATRTGVTISPVVTINDTVQANTVDSTSFVVATDTTKYTVTLTPKTVGQTIRYITGATPADPTASTGTIYTGPFLMDRTFKVKAITTGTGLKISDVKTYGTGS